jgi:hypothetical protein
MRGNCTALVTMLVLILFETWDPPVQQERKRRGRTVRKRRRTVSSIMCELGAHARRACRMESTSFWELHQILFPFLKRRSRGRKRKRGKTPNGSIATAARLSMALRYFAGGSPIDISVVHGVSHSEVFVSAWMVVDAVNQCDSLAITFPTCHTEQQRLAAEFYAASGAGMRTCLAATDGLLVWTNKPSPADCELTGCGPTKFMCGRKHKFGLNMQATCDLRGRFLDIFIGHPGSTSYCLSFITSSLRHKLETPGFLAPGLHLIGDNACTNTPHMATPYPATTGGSKDAYNFYHSQLRIRVECSFGMLVHRWGVLQKPVPCCISAKKTTALVTCLCRLHNFCIDQSDIIVAKNTGVDDLNIAVEGIVPLAGTRDLPEQLIGGGSHFDDTTSRERRQDAERARNLLGATAQELPRDILHRMVVQKDLCRPRPEAWDPS